MKALNWIEELKVEANAVALGQIIFNAGNDLK